MGPKGQITVLAPGITALPSTADRPTASLFAQLAGTLDIAGAAQYVQQPYQRKRGRGP